MLNSQIKKLASDREMQVLLASILWIVLTAAATTIFVLGTMGLYEGLRVPCAVFEPHTRALCMERQTSLAQLGISLDSYVLFLVVGVIVEVLPWILVGIVIFWRKSDALPGISFSLALILLGTIALDDIPAAWALFYHPWLVPAVKLVEFVGFSGLALWYAFPDGQFVPRWTRWLALFWALRTFGFTFLRGTWLDIGSWRSVSVFFIMSLLLSLAWRYYRAANALQKRQIRWVAAGATLYGIVYFLRLIPALQGGSAVTPLQLGYATVLYVSSLLLALCLGISILRPRLLERVLPARRQMTENRPQTTEDRPQRTEDRPQRTEDRPQRTDGGPQMIEDRPQMTEDRPPTTDRGPQTKENKPKTGKKKRKKK